MADEAKKDIKEVKAFARGIHISPRKARLVVNLIKKMPVSEAFIQLEFITKKAARPIQKLIDSAVANAKHNFQIEEDRLFVKNLNVDGGRSLFRYNPRAKGRAFPVRKRTSHLNLTLGVSAVPFTVRAAKRQAILPRAPATQSQAAKDRELVETSAPPVEQESFFKKFWKRRKPSDTTQVPPKEDAKGRHYTGFDRRGKMGE